ncbi:SGNH/GDSL hydrolase family protein [Streptomyces sp. NPDC090106]|uniref:SGNH/GDSL hydrolase family protein n=1 Tax=Streptomyces sp. NPDC090106 TaxID=3365946 RepID=UPI0038045256
MPHTPTELPCLLFQGDSITAAGRAPDDPEGLGEGYVQVIHQRLEAVGKPARLLNRGVNGHGSAELPARWQRDTLASGPHVVTLLVGINDVWRRATGLRRLPVDAYERSLRALIEQTRDVGARLVLLEPFLVPVRAEQWLWRADLDARIQVVRRLAAEYGAALIALDGMLNQAASAAGGAEKITEDGIHPTPLGHTLIAEAWLDAQVAV